MVRSAELLAQRRSFLHLTDISQRLLDTAATRLQTAGLANRIVNVVQASATHLAHIETETCDGVLLLGPLYHLPDLADREQAVREAARILKPKGVLFAAAINRLAYLRDSFRENGDLGAEERTFHAQFLLDGNLDPEHAPPIAYAHLSTSDEFRALFTPTFDEIAYVGVESFTGVWSAKLKELSHDASEAWLDLVEQTGQSSDGLGASDHFLYIGRKRLQSST